MSSLEYLPLSAHLARGSKSPMEGVQSANQTAHSGDDTMESEDGAGQSENRPSQTVEGLFGDAADLSSS